MPLLDWIPEVLARFGRIGLGFFERLGRGVIFLLSTLAALPSLLLRPRLLIQQLYAVGVLTIVIILVAGLFVGMVLGLQGYNILVRFNSESSLGVMVGLSLVRELGPVMTALLFAGRAGSALTAEIGLMKATVNPYKRVFAPRLFAGFLALPLLAAIFSAVGVCGGYFVGVGLLGVDSGAYWSQMQDAVDIYDDLLAGVTKTIVFGFFATWIALYEGYDCVPTSEGVSRATTRSVVNASLVVLGLNFVLTALMIAGE
jgi:phospholipid/cholesterol/gamma-HCH transport system permease protein